MKYIISNPGMDIWLVGGSKTISIFMNFGFVDEIILSIILTVLGKGITLFVWIYKKKQNLS